MKVKKIILSLVIGFLIIGVISPVAFAGNQAQSSCANGTYPGLTITANGGGDLTVKIKPGFMAELYRKIDALQNTTPGANEGPWKYLQTYILGSFLIFGQIIYLITLTMASVFDSLMQAMFIFPESLIDLWILIRNYVNILFLPLLLFIAIANITGYEKTNTALKVVLPRFIAGVIMVNFSFPHPQSLSILNGEGRSSSMLAS
jgi:hypothetical protein